MAVNKSTNELINLIWFTKYQCILAKLETLNYLIWTVKYLLHGILYLKERLDNINRRPFRYNLLSKKSLQAKAWSLFNSWT